MLLAFTYCNLRWCFPVLGIQAIGRVTRVTTFVVAAESTIKRCPKHDYGAISTYHLRQRYWLLQSWVRAVQASIILMLISPTSLALQETLIRHCELPTSKLGANLI